MLYAMPARTSNQRFAGFVFVGAMHAALFAVLTYCIVRSVPLTKEPPPVVIVKPDKVEKTPVQQTPVKAPNMDSDLVQLPMPEVPIQVNLPPPPITGEFNPDIRNSVPPVPGNTGAKSEGIKQASVGIACPNSQSVRGAVPYPPAAIRGGVQGDVVARFVVGTNGQIRDISIVQSSSRLFNLTVMSAIREFQCVGQSSEVQVEVPFTFRLNN